METNLKEKEGEICRLEVIISSLKAETKNAEDRQYQAYNRIKHENSAQKQEISRLKTEGEKTTPKQ